MISRSGVPMPPKRVKVFAVFWLLVQIWFVRAAISESRGVAPLPAFGVEDLAFAAHAENDPSGPRPEQVPPNPISPSWQKEIVDTAAGAEYLTDPEKQVILEINMVRADPAEYARRFLVPLRSYYRRTRLQFPGELPILTHEGVRALDECIRELQVAKPVSALSPAKGLALAARDHARDQGTTGMTGHFGSAGSTPPNRISRYGTWDISAGEDIDYGNADPQRIVISLLVDDGVASRGHRAILLDGGFRFVGVSLGPHSVYRHMCVLDFAGSYRAGEAYRLEVR
jgi:uncharacterized protein YkwD